MIYELSSLSHLALECNEEILGDPISWQSVIQRLPVTLETLSIRSLDARLALLHSKPGIKVEYVTTQYARGPSRLLDLETMFPRLRKLKIITTENYSPHPDLLTSDLPGLPSTLESLETRMLLSSPASILSLPPSLRFLLGRIVLGFEPANHPPPVWPPHLENVEWHGRIHPRKTWFSPASKEANLSSAPGWTVAHSSLDLPTTLRSFRANGVIAQESWGVLACPKLPDTLTKLSLNSVDPLSLGSLPQCLRIINIDTSYDYDPIGQQCLENGSGTTETSFWPPGLEELSFASAFASAAHLVTLPPSLKLLKLNIKFDPGETSPNESIDLNALLPNLTHLTSNMSGMLGIKPIRLPENLRQLVLNAETHHFGYSLSISWPEPKASPTPLKPATQPTPFDPMHGMKIRGFKPNTGGDGFVHFNSPPAPALNSTKPIANPIDSPTTSAPAGTVAPLGSGFKPLGSGFKPLGSGFNATPPPTAAAPSPSPSALGSTAAPLGSGFKPLGSGFKPLGSGFNAAPPPTAAAPFSSASPLTAVPTPSMPNQAIRGIPMRGTGMRAVGSFKPTLEGLGFATLLPSTLLTSLWVPEWPADLFNLLPRGLLHLRVGRLPDVDTAKSTQFKAGQLFEELPPRLMNLTLGEETPEEFPKTMTIRDTFVVHFENLVTLIVIGIALPSQFMRFVPQNLEVLRVKLTGLVQEDAPFIPSRVRLMYLGPWVDPRMPHIAPHWPALRKERGDPSSYVYRKELERCRQKFDDASPEIGPDGLF